VGRCYPLVTDRDRSVIGVAAGGFRGSEEITDVGVPHVVVIDAPDPAGDLDREDVPALLGGVLAVQVVLGVLTGTAAVLDDVLFGVTDHDGEIAVLLDPPLRNRLDRPDPPVAV